MERVRALGDMSVLGLDARAVEGAFFNEVDGRKEGEEWKERRIIIIHHAHDALLSSPIHRVSMRSQLYNSTWERESHTFTR